MNTKHLEKAFKKMLHPDLKDMIDFSLENFDNKSQRGQVIFMDDFEEIYTCGFKMTQMLDWYLGNPKMHHSTAKNSESGYEMALSLMDSNTGSRHIEDYNEDKDEFVQIIYQLRKKYQ